jgi:hypothetical protein
MWALPVQLTTKVDCVVLAGATCPDGSNFVPVVNGSQWDVNQSSGNHLYRLVKCPAGYIISRDDKFPDQDRCVQCQVGTYSLIVATSTAVACQPCPVGGTCPGGDVVLSIDGYWRRLNGTSFATAEIFKCPVGKFAILVFLHRFSAFESLISIPASYNLFLKTRKLHGSK